MRQKIVAGNWKMNNNEAESIQLIQDINTEIANESLENVRVIVAPTYVSLSSSIKAAQGSKIEVAAQNMHQEKSGAYTGEISAEMLTSLGIKTVILGHSERREYFNETDDLIAKKIDTALSSGLEIIFCFGEKLEERKLDNHLLEVGSQLRNTLFHLKASDFKNIILAYEPVWAIGTGETATPKQAQEMHNFVRNVLEKKFGKEVSETISILYGGSVKPENAAEIFSKPDVDGGLIGGASLKANDFSAIIKAI